MAFHIQKRKLACRTLYKIGPVEGLSLEATVVNGKYGRFPVDYSTEKTILSKCIKGLSREQLLHMKTKQRNVVEIKC
jgi:hypothetical protein